MNAISFSQHEFVDVRDPAEQVYVSETLPRLVTQPSRGTVFSLAARHYFTIQHSNTLRSIIRIGTSSTPQPHGAHGENSPEQDVPQTRQYLGRISRRRSFARGRE